MSTPHPAGPALRLRSDRRSTMQRADQGFAPVVYCDYGAGVTVRGMKAAAAYARSWRLPRWRMESPVGARGFHARAWPSREVRSAVRCRDNRPSFEGRTSCDQLPAVTYLGPRHGTGQNTRWLECGCPGGSTFGARPDTGGVAWRLTGDEGPELVLFDAQTGGVISKGRLVRPYGSQGGAGTAPLIASSDASAELNWKAAGLSWEAGSFAGSSRMVAAGDRTR